MTDSGLREALVPVEGCLLRECDHDYKQDCLDDFRANLQDLEGAPVERGVSQMTRLSSAPSTSVALDVERLARALELELNRTHRAGHYDELAAAIAAAYAADAEEVST